MPAYAPNLLRAIHRYAGKIQTMRDDFRMAHFMYSLPEDMRKDLGWPDFKNDRISRKRHR